MLGAYWRYRVGDYRIICDFVLTLAETMLAQLANEVKKTSTLVLLEWRFRPYLTLTE